MGHLYKHELNTDREDLVSIDPSQMLIIQDGRLLLGRWQSVYFCEFDGPRKRTFYVKIIEG